MGRWELEEFDRQVENLLAKRYHEAAKISEAAFCAALAPLRKRIPKRRKARTSPEDGHLPFVIVIAHATVPSKWAMGRVVRLGKRGHEAMKPVKPSDFGPLDWLSIPDGLAYLLIDTDRGRDSLNVRPEDALKQIVQAGRSPLTIDEGVAVVTQHPEFLQKNNCFSLAGSRRQDQRVPAIWIDGDKRPKLGWCWDRNPHTWLGTASCAKRVGLPKPSARER
jgi:hypothetical protein